MGNALGSGSIASGGLCSLEINLLPKVVSESPEVSDTGTRGTEVPEAQSHLV